MKRILLLLLFGIVGICSIDAQDSRYIGTWKYHNEATMGDGEHYNWDYFIRIDIEDSNIYVRLKLITNIDGKEYQKRTEGEHVMVNTDGSISFDDFLSKNEYHQDDYLYWTVWQHYVVKYESGRLNVSQKLMGEGYNGNGYLVKDEKQLHPINHMVYYNEKDNW